MKALIVDDEQHVREAINILANWKELGIQKILEAEDGQQAIEMINAEQPQIIITDMMMPVKNGVALMEWIQCNAARSQVIVVSGYKDFEFLRKTIIYGGIDYLLKPVKPDLLQEALHKAVSHWNQEEELLKKSQQTHIEISQMKGVYKDKLLSDLILNPGLYPKNKNQVRDQFPTLYSTKACRVVVLSLDKRRTDGLNLDINNLFQSLLQISNKILNHKDCGIAFQHWNNSGEIVLLFWDEQYGIKVKSIITQIQDDIYQMFRTRIDFGVGKVEPFPDGLFNTYQAAKIALRQRNLLDDSVHFHESSMEMIPRSNFLYMKTIEENLYLAIISGNTKNMNSIIELWFEKVQQLSCITFEQYEQWLHEYSLMKNRWLEQLFEQNGSNIIQLQAKDILPFDSNGKLSLSLWQQQVKEDVSSITEQLLNYQVRTSNTIYAIAQYVENNYKIDLTLQDISDLFQLSREHISRTFKQFFRETLTDYRSRIRIEKAKSLLLNPLLNISEVAELVGYNDEKYFSKQFKKYTLVTPKEYRTSIK